MNDRTSRFKYRFRLRTLLLITTLIALLIPMLGFLDRDCRRCGGGGGVLQNAGITIVIDCPDCAGTGRVSFLRLWLDKVSCDE
jgi:hypothetical protein